MFKKKFLHWVACVILLACWLGPKAAFAQQGAGVLVGTVTDASTKAPVPDVVVTVTSPALQGEQTVVTDSTGTYRVPDLPPGEYTVRLEKEQYRPFSRGGIGLRADTTLRVNADLLPETIKAEEVTVIARAPTVDVGSSSTGMSISQEFTRRIPVSRPGNKGSASRSFESVAEAAPGANADRYGTSVNGTTSPENQYVLDGMSVNNPAYGVIGTPLTIEFVKEVNVLSGGYMPEYGRTTGAMLNVVTQSGGNEFHGGAWVFYSPGALEGKRKTVLRDGQTVLTTQELAYQGDFGAAVGGPIMKDKLWFFVGLDLARTRLNVGKSYNSFRVNSTWDATSRGYIVDRDTGFRQTDPIGGTTTSYVAQSDQLQAMGKLTYLINPDNTIALAVFTTPSWSGGGGKFSLNPQNGQFELDVRTAPNGLAGTYEALAHKRLAGSFDTSLKWSSAFDNKRVLLDTTLGWHHENYSVLPSDGTAVGSQQGLSGVPRIIWRQNRAPDFHSIRDFDGNPALGAPCGAVMVNDAMGMPHSVSPCPVQTYSSGGPDFLQDSSLDRYQARSVLTYLLQGAGHHVFKAGIDVEYQRYDNTKAYSGRVRYREATGGGNFADNRQYGFLQGPDDAVVLDKLHTVTKSVIAGGFVQDSWSVLDMVTLNLGLRYDAQFLYAADGNRGLSLPNEWSPRAGVIYDPTQAGRSKIFGNYARFYENVPLDIADRSLSSENSIQSVHAKGTAANPCPVAGLPATTQGPCLDPAHQLAVNDPVDPNAKWTTTGAGATPVDPDIKPQSSDEIVFGGEYEVIKDGRVGVSYTKRWMNYVIEDMSRDEAQTYFLGNPGYGIAKDFPKAERNYDAFTLYFQKIFADEWLAQASYTLSWLRGNYPGLFRPETTQLDPNINADFDLRSLLSNRTGDLPGDRRHSVKLFGAKDWALQPEHHVTTGLALTGHSGEPTNYLGSHIVYGFDEAFVLPRGSGERLPWVFSGDVNLAYRFNVDKDKSLTASIDVFNLLNFQAATQRDQRYTASDVNPVTNGNLATLTHADGSPFDPTTEKNPNFGHPNEYQPPRIFRFGLRGTF